jgi:hypothetical protein
MEYRAHEQRSQGRDKRINSAFASEWEIKYSVLRRKKNNNSKDRTLYSEQNICFSSCNLLIRHPEAISFRHLYITRDFIGICSPPPSHHNNSGATPFAVNYIYWLRDRFHARYPFGVLDAWFVLMKVVQPDAMFWRYWVTTWQKYLVPLINFELPRLKRQFQRARREKGPRRGTWKECRKMRNSRVKMNMKRVQEDEKLQSQDECGPGMY